MAWIDHQGRLTGQLFLGNQLLENSEMILPPKDNPLALFSHLSLEELGTGSLLDPKETKYIFSKDRMKYLHQIASLGEGEISHE